MKSSKWPKLPKLFKKRWLAALRSGEFNQGTDLLRSAENKYCCLGVACAISGYKNISNNYHCIPIKEETQNRHFNQIPDILRGDSDNPVVKVLVHMNDNSRLSFKQIANWIEKNL